MPTFLLGPNQEYLLLFTCIYRWLEAAGTQRQEMYWTALGFGLVIDNERANEAEAYDVHEEDERESEGQGSERRGGTGAGSFGRQVFGGQVGQVR